MSSASATQIRGTVTTADGAPVEWATAWFAAGDHPTPDIAAVTSATGAFTLTAPAPGTYRVGCRAEGFDPVERDVTVPEGGVDVTIALQPTTPTS